MPDTPYLDSSIQSGPNDLDRLQLKLDTQNNFDKILNTPIQTQGNFNFFQQPAATEPNENEKILSDIKAGSANFSDYLIHPDKNVRDAANSIVYDKVKNDPFYKSNVGGVQNSPYDSSMEKFLSKDYGYRPDRDNEDFYYRNVYMQDPWYSRIPKNLFRFGARVVEGAASKFLEGLGYIGSMAVNTIDEGTKALSGEETSFWADVADNSFSKLMRDADSAFRDQIIPVYKKSGFDQQGFFSKLTDATYWNDSVADGVAFMVSAMIPAGIASKAGWLSKGAGLFGEANNLAKAANLAVKAVSGADTFGEFGLAAFNVANEAAFEASDTFKNVKKNLIDARAKGENNLTDQEIDSKAGSEASSTFGWNIAALSTSQAWEMKNIYKPMLGLEKRAIADAGKITIDELGKAEVKNYANKFVNKVLNSSTGKRIGFYGEKAAEATLMEGFWEENIQNAIQRSNQGGYTRTGDDTSPEGVQEKTKSGFLGIISQFAKQTVDALKGNDRENSESIGLGGLIGIIGGSTGAKLGTRENPNTGQKSFFLGERRQEEMETNIKIAEINNAYNNRMSIKDIKNADGTIDTDKLKAKIASFDSIDLQQQILNQIKDEAVMPVEDVQSLENKLLNDYTKSLAKVGKVDDAISRFENIAKKPAEDRQQIMSDPLESASYMREVNDIYNKIQKTNIQNKIPEGISPQQMDSINEARKDRAFDLLAERRALKPVTDKYHQTVSDQFSHINDFLANQVTGSEYIQEGLARTKATDYIKALAKKDFFTKVSDRDAPDFVKEFYKSKVQEADNEIKSLDDFLGNSKPVIKDGDISFNDHTIDFDSKLLKSLTDGYKSAYSDEAHVNFLQDQNDHIANSLLHPEKGYDNWNNYVNYIKDTMEKQNLKTTPETQVPTDTDTNNTINTQTPVDTDTNADNDTPIPVVEDDTFDVTDKPVITNPIEANKTPTDTIDSSKDITWQTPLISSKSDTNTLDNDTEQLRDIPYDEMRKDFISNVMSDPDFSSSHKLFIVKDTFNDIYHSPSNNENSEDFVPTGEVIILEKNDGTRPNVRDFFPKKYKEMHEMPIVFSFNKQMFFQNGLSQRAAIWAAKYELPIENAINFYNSEHEKSLKARALLITTTDKVSISMIDSNPGVLPTSTSTTVAERFGDDFKINIETRNGQPFNKGAVVVKFANASFAVGTSKLQSDGGELSNVEAILNKEFITKEEAYQVREQYLNSLFNTNEDSFFSVIKQGDNFKIVYRKIQDGDKDLSKEEKRKAAKVSNESIGQIQFNVNRKALDNGLNKYDAVTGTFKNISQDEYTDFIKTKLITSLKKTLTKEGKLYMKPVNASFSFQIDDTRLKVDDTVKVQEQNYDKVIAKIKQLSDNKELTNEKIEQVQSGLTQMVTDNKISSTQKNRISNRLDELKSIPFDKKADIERRRQEELDRTLKSEQDYINLAKEYKISYKPVSNSMLSIKEGNESHNNLVNTIEKLINDKYNIELTTLDNKEEIDNRNKTNTENPQEKVPTLTSEKPKSLAESKKARAKQKTTDLNEVLGNVVTQNYSTTIGTSEYIFDGVLKENKKFGMAIRTFVVTKSDPNFKTALDNLVQSNPLVKYSDGSITGFAKAEIEGYTAYAVPSRIEHELFFDENNKFVTERNEDGVEISPVEKIKSGLSEEGKTQLEEFLKRNC